MDCMWIGLTGTRARNPLWPSCCSLAEMRLAQNMLTSFKEPIAIGSVACYSDYSVPAYQSIYTHAHDP